MKKDSGAIFSAKEKNKMKKEENIDDWVEETIMKTMQEGKLYELLFTERGRQFTEGYPKKKVQGMVNRCLKKL